MAKPFSEKQSKVVQEMIEKAVAKVSPKGRPSQRGKDPMISQGHDDQDPEDPGDLKALGQTIRTPGTRRSWGPPKITTCRAPTPWTRIVRYLVGMMIFGILCA
jgi:hypothetical protein